jgi:hypothetical protein
VEDRGFEPLTAVTQGQSPSELTATPQNTLAYSLARESQKDPDSFPLADAKIDPDLARLIAAWPSLSVTVKRMILAALAEDES